jgi:hypothetical protein
MRAGVEHKAFNTSLRNTDFLSALDQRLAAAAALARFLWVRDRPGNWTLTGMELRCRGSRKGARSPIAPLLSILVYGRYSTAGVLQLNWNRSFHDSVRVSLCRRCIRMRSTAAGGSSKQVKGLMVQVLLIAHTIWEAS